MTFEIKLANGKEASFDTAVGLSDFYERMRPKPKKRKKKVDAKKVGAAHGLTVYAEGERSEDEVQEIEKVEEFKKQREEAYNAKNSKNS